MGPFLAVTFERLAIAYATNLAAKAKAEKAGQEGVRYRKAVSGA